MNVLIADDDSAAPFALSRLLTRDFGATVTEVSNGLDALDALSRHRFSFLMLDVQMPVMDGLETLRAIRTNPDFADVPVIMMTVIKDEAQVREILRLGVLDYLVKPLKVKAVTERLQRLMRVLASQEIGYRPALGSECISSGTVIVADGDAAFRQYFKDLLPSGVAMLPAESGVQALKLCLASPPRALFVGRDLGALSHEALVGKVRTLALLGDAHIIAVAPADELPQMLRSAKFDGGLVRTFVPHVFRQHLQRLLGTPDALRRVLGMCPQLRLNVISVTAQVFGMMLLLELHQSADSPPADGDVGAAVTIVLRREALTIDVRVRTSLGAAREIAARLTAANRDDISDQDTRSAMAEIANIISGRLQRGLADRGTEAACELPVLQDEFAPYVPATDSFSVSFTAVPGDFAFSVDLCARAGAEPPLEAAAAPATT